MIKDADLAWTLSSVPKPFLFPAQVLARVAGGNFEVTTATMGVRIPAPDKTTFRVPVAAAAVPAPIIGFRLPNGTWAGKGWLETARKVTAWSQTVVADGPLYKEYAYEVRFAPRGYYRMRVTVEAELSAARIAEEYDLGDANAENDFVRPRAQRGVDAGYRVVDGVGQTAGRSIGTGA